MESIALDSYVRKHGLAPDFIRIDVGEDYEKVLEGSESIIRNDHPTILICGYDEGSPRLLPDSYDRSYSCGNDVLLWRSE